MHPQATNVSAESQDDQRLIFEPVGVFEFINEYSGFAVAPAPISLSQNSSMHVPAPTVACQEVCHELY